MKRKHGTIAASNQNRSSPVLLKARSLMDVYSRATGACICINDHNSMPIPEIADEINSEKNVCHFCIKYRGHAEEKNGRGICANPCGKMHCNAVKEAHRFGGSYIYTCELGFMFWTSPIYFDKQFAGALIGSGFLGTDIGETCARMHNICGGALSEAELKLMFGRFKQAEPRKIKAMAELMLICAKTLSVKSEGCHAAMRRRAEQQAELSAKIGDMKDQYHPGSPRPEYPLDKERQLLEALRRGDIESGRQILNEILAALFSANSDQFKHIQYRAMELAVLLNRIDGPGFLAKTVLEANNRYIKSIQEANDIEDLTDILYQIVDNIAGQVNSFQGIHHASALKKAERFIMENFARKISLEEIAKASGFSAPYFSTIFKDEMGENLSSYLNRLRVERSAFMLTDTDLSLGKIAWACGFEDQSWFSKIFKLYAGMSPGKYRNQGGKPVSKNPPIGFSANYRKVIEKTQGR